MLSLIRIGLSLHTNQSIMSHDLLHYPCWDPKLDRQTEREKVSFGQTVQHRGMICTILIALYFHQVFNPRTMLGGGYLYPQPYYSIPGMPLRLLRRSRDYIRGIR